jgi:hypothetical protein
MAVPLLGTNSRRCNLRTTGAHTPHCIRRLAPTATHLVPLRGTAGFAVPDVEIRKDGRTRSSRTPNSDSYLAHAQTGDALRECHQTITLYQRARRIPRESLFPT